MRSTEASTVHALASVWLILLTAAATVVAAVGQRAMKAVQD